MGIGGFEKYMMICWPDKKVNDMQWSNLTRNMLRGKADRYFNEIADVCSSNPYSYNSF